MVFFYHFEESLGELLLKLPEAPYVLVTCLDSNWKPADYLHRVSSPDQIWHLEGAAILTGKEAKRLANLENVFVIFSEVWFFNDFPKALPLSPDWALEEPYEPSSNSILETNTFMSKQGAILAMGDGFGTNILAAEPFSSEIDRLLLP